MTMPFCIDEAGRAQAALAAAIGAGNADAIIAASARLSALIAAAGSPTPVSDSRPLGALRSDIIATHRTLNLLRDAASRRAAGIAQLRGLAPAATYRQRATR